MPSILTTVVGSYPIPDWLAAMPSQQALIDATRVVFKTQEMAGIDVVADGEHLILSHVRVLVRQERGHRLQAETLRA